METGREAGNRRSWIAPRQPRHSGSAAPPSSVVETLEMPWGARLIPVDELQRLLAERRQPARKQPRPAPPGRPTALPPEVADRIRTARAAGRSLAQIARELNATGTPTAHGGAQWWFTNNPNSDPDMPRRPASIGNRAYSPAPSATGTWVSDCDRFDGAPPRPGRAVRVLRLIYAPSSRAGVFLARCHRCIPL